MEEEKMGNSFGHFQNKKDESCFEKKDLIFTLLGVESIIGGDINHALVRPSEGRKKPFTHCGWTYTHSIYVVGKKGFSPSLNDNVLATTTNEIEHEWAYRRKKLRRAWKNFLYSVRLGKEKKTVDGLLFVAFIARIPFELGSRCRRPERAFDAAYKNIILG